MSRTKTVLVFLMVILLASCTSYKEITLTSVYFQNNLDNSSFFWKTEKNQTRLMLKDNGTEYIISNLVKSGETNGFIYLFLSEEGESGKQLLVVFNKDDGRITCCDFYPETSRFYEDDLICFVFKVTPDVYPLPHSYCIETHFYDFVEGKTEESVLWDRNRYLGSPETKDFYYQRPVFYKEQSIPEEYLLVRDSRILKSGELIGNPVFYAVWEQAGFPVRVMYYFKDSHHFSYNDTYLECGISGRNEVDEFIPREVTSLKSGQYEVSLLCTNTDKPDYKDYEIRLSNGNDSRAYCLADLFEYQDPLKRVDMCGIQDECARLIITTRVFSYDLSINIITGETSTYLRESSFSLKERNRGQE